MNIQETSLKTFNQTLAVVRGYNNRKVIDRIIMLINLGVTVVFSGPPCEQSEIWIKEEGLDTNPLFIREVIDDYHHTETRPHDRWCAGLNAGIPHLLQGNFTTYLALSGETLVTEGELQQMLDHFNLNPNLGVLGTTYAAYKDGQPVLLGPSYSNRARNTCAMWSAELFKPGNVLENGFDARCDALGGMEDYFAAMQVLQESEMDVMTLNLKVHLVVGTNHDQKAKEERELEAMHRINLLFAEDLKLKTATMAERVEKFALVAA